MMYTDVCKFNFDCVTETETSRNISSEIKVIDNSICVSWNKTSECVPDAGDKRTIQILTLTNGRYRLLYFDKIDSCWNDESNDDFLFDIEDVECWMYLPEPPCQ